MSADTIEYRFASEHVEAVRNGVKTATVRLNDKRAPIPGDWIEAIGPDGESICALPITAVARVPVSRALGFVQWANARHDADSELELVRELREHYPSTTIAPDTPTQVIVFSDDGEL